MVSKGRHPKSAVAKALDSLPHDFEIVELHNGHRWGKILCRECDADQGVWSSPRDADNHAKQIQRFAAKHEHTEGTA